MASEGVLPDWSALPDLPLGSIARRLPTLMDFLSFRGVCVSWRAVGRAIEGVVMASHPPLCFESSLNCFYHPVEKRFYRKATSAGAFTVGQSHGHFILVRGCALWLLNPLTGAENHCFPRLERPIRLPITGAVLSSPPTSPGCVLVAYDFYGIQFCRPGDKEWCVVRWPGDQIGDPLSKVYTASVVGGKGYVLLGGQGLAMFDFTTGPPELTILNAEHILDSPGLLAESKGQLFAFSYAWTSLARQFVVFRFDSPSCKWVRSENLGGRAAFVDTCKGPVFVDNCDKWGGSKDCIYFFDPDLMQVLEYKMEDGRSRPFLLPIENPDSNGFIGTWVLPSLS